MAKNLHLKAQSTDDLNVIAGLIQDAIGKTGDIAWMPKTQRFACVFNRFKWEDNIEPAQRTRTGLHIEGVLNVKAKGFNPNKPDQVYSVLTLQFNPSDEGTGTINFICAGGAEFQLSVEYLDVTLADISDAWKTNHIPTHEDD